MADDIREALGIQDLSTPQEETIESAVGAHENRVNLRAELQDLMSGQRVIGEPEKPAPDASDTAVEDVTKDAKKAETEQFYQTRYQKLVETIKKFDPSIPNAIKQMMDAENAGPIAGPLAPAQSKSIEFSDEDMVDPKKILEAINTIPKTVEETFNRVQRQARVAARVETERDNLVQSLKSVQVDNGISDDEMNAAFQEAMSFGINVGEIGGYTKLGRVMTTVLMNRALSNAFQGNAAKLEAVVSQKVKGAQLASQPQAGALPAPKQLTPEQKILQSLQDAGRNKATKEVFGG